MGKIAIVLGHISESLVVTQSISPVVFVYRKNVVGIEATAIEFPKSQCPSGSPVPISKGVNVLESVVQRFLRLGRGVLV